MALSIPTIDRLRGGLDAALDAGIADAADAIVTLAQELVAVDTGALRDSIHADGEDGSGQRTVQAGGADAPYAPFVEYGTQHMAAQPFFTPAIAQVDVAAFVRARVADLIGGG